MVDSDYWAAGQGTGDTALALELAESIAEHGLLDVDDVARRYIHWAVSDGRGIGRATRAALTGASDAAEARRRASEFHALTGMGAGNGTVMRCAPIGLAARDLDEARTAAVADAQLTHGHPAAAPASTALCAALLALREGGNPLAARTLRGTGAPRTRAGARPGGSRRPPRTRRPGHGASGGRLLDHAGDRALRACTRRGLHPRRRLGDLARRRHRHQRRRRGPARLPTRTRRHPPSLARAPRSAPPARGRGHGARPPRRNQRRMIALELTRLGVAVKVRAERLADRAEERG
jgi:hypothetical protein